MNARVDIRAVSTLLSHGGKKGPEMLAVAYLARRSNPHTWTDARSDGLT